MSRAYPPAVGVVEVATIDGECQRTVGMVLQLETDPECISPGIPEELLYPRCVWPIECCRLHLPDVRLLARADAGGRRVDAEDGRGEAELRVKTIFDERRGILGKEPEGKAKKDQYGGYALQFILFSGLG